MAPAELTHIVVVCMENRSFDHMLGGRKLAGLSNAGDGLDASMSNPDRDGNLVVVYPADVECVVVTGSSLLLQAPSPKATAASVRIARYFMVMVSLLSVAVAKWPA